MAGKDKDKNGNKQDNEEQEKQEAGNVHSIGDYSPKQKPLQFPHQPIRLPQKPRRNGDDGGDNIA